MIDPDLISRSLSNLRAGLGCIADGVAVAILAHDEPHCNRDLRDAHAEAIAAVEHLMVLAKHAEDLIVPAPAGNPEILEPHHVKPGTQTPNQP